MRKLLGGSPDFVPNLFKLAGPVALQNVINQSLVLIDTFMGGALGESELAALTLANTVIFVIFIFFFGLQSGAMILIGQYWGKRDPNAINRVLGISVLFSAALGMITGLGGLLFPHAIASVLTNNEVVAALAARYLRYAAPSLFFNGLSTAYTTAQRSMENPRIGLVVHTTSAAVNTFLGWTLIFGNVGAPALGVEGAGLALLSARILECLLAICFAIGDKRFKIEPRLFFRPGRIIFKDYMRFVMPVLVSEMLWSLGFSLYPIIMGHLPDSAAGLAVFSLASAVEKVFTAISSGMTTASAVMIGKGLGEGKSVPDMRRLGRTLLTMTVGYGFLAAIFMVLIAFFLLPLLLPMFNLSAGAKQGAFVMLLLYAVLLPAHSNNFCCIAGILRGGGDVRAAAILDVSAMYLIGLPLAALLGLGLGLGAAYVVVGIIAEEYAKGVLILLRMRQGKWLNNVTRDVY